MKTGGPAFPRAAFATSEVTHEDCGINMRPKLEALLAEIQQRIDDRTVSANWSEAAECVRIRDKLAAILEGEA